MTNKEIMERLALKGIRQVDIAQKFNVSGQRVSQLFRHGGRFGITSLIRQYIADKISCRNTERERYVEVWEEGRNKDK